MNGLFITFEGVEGCGKTTQITLLKEFLEHKGHTVVATREPGGTPIAEKIRHILLNADHDEMAHETELLLYAAARAQHVVEKIKPALEKGHIVICDRYYDSTTAYQGAGRSIDREKLNWLHAYATVGCIPDITFLIDLPVNIGLKRVIARAEADRLERETIDFHQRVRDGFLAIAKAEPNRVTIIDGTQSIEDIQINIQELVNKQLG